MNLCWKYSTLYWNAACLITDSGGQETEEDEGKSSNYDKIAKAIGKMTEEGITVYPPDINSSSYTFTPDEKNNRILFGLRGIVRVGDDLIRKIMANRPYTSVEDFYSRIYPDKQAMISLIKSGAFDSLQERRRTMVQFIWSTCDKKNNLTMQNFPGLLRNELVPEDTDERVLARRVFEFNRYLKNKCKSADVYVIDERASIFLAELGIFIAEGDTISAKEWDKTYQKHMDVFRNWLAESKSEVLDVLNEKVFMADWKKYGDSGNLSSWEMQSISFYYHEHELSHINLRKYGISKFKDLSEIPVVDKLFRGSIPIYRLTNICGTCIAKNKNKGLAYLLTIDGVVTVHFNKEYFSMFDKQISAKQEDGSKKVIERSWFNKGSMLVVQGYRRGEEFVPKKYAASGGHLLYKIDEIKPNGDIILRSERYSGIEEEDYD